MIVRTPFTSVPRMPILTEGEKFQTIASNNQNYDGYEVMGTYSDIESARRGYVSDMDNMRKLGRSFSHYAIIQVTAHPERLN